MDTQAQEKLEVIENAWNVGIWSEPEARSIGILLKIVREQEKEIQANESLIAKWRQEAWDMKSEIQGLKTQLSMYERVVKAAKYWRSLMIDKIGFMKNDEQRRRIHHENRVAAIELKKTVDALEEST